MTTCSITASPNGRVWIVYAGAEIVTLAPTFEDAVRHARGEGWEPTISPDDKAAVTAAAMSLGIALSDDEQKRLREIARLITRESDRDDASRDARFLERLAEGKRTLFNP